MHLRVTHLTRYYYSRKVSLSPHRLYLRPRETPRNLVRNFKLQFAPVARVVPTLDMQDNAMDWAYWQEPTAAVNIETEFEIETLDGNPFDFLTRADAFKWPFSYEPAEFAALRPYMAPPDAAVQDRLRRWIGEKLPDPPPESLPFLTALNSAVTRSISYRRRDEEGIQTASETLDRGTGSCRDFATLLIELLRTQGFAARFVSGYLYEPTHPVESGDVRTSEESRMERDQALPTAMHAWTEVYLPGGGWRGLDPTRAILCNDAFIPVAHAIRGETVSPVQGSYAVSSPVTSELHADISVVRLDGE